MLSPSNIWKATEVFHFLKKTNHKLHILYVRTWTCRICHVGTQQFDELRYQERRRTGWQCTSDCKAARLQLMISGSCYHFKDETLSIYIRVLHWLLLDHLPSFSSCSVWCLSNRALQTQRWVKTSHCACSWNITVPKKCYCTQRKKAAAVSQSQKTLSDLLWLYFSPLQYSDVSLTCHKSSQLVFKLLATG